jgi:hypothetical protein
MEYSSPSNCGVIAAISGRSLKELPTATSFPGHFQNNIDCTSRLSLIVKAVQNSHHQRVQIPTPIINDHNLMTSNISDILRSNKSSKNSSMMESGSPMDMLENAGGGSGARASVFGFSGGLCANNTSAITENVASAASLRRPLKRTKLEGDQGDGSNAFPPSVILIPSHQQHSQNLQLLFQEQQQFAEYSSGQSHGDDTESRESQGRNISASSNHHQQQHDGTNSGVRFREYQAEIWSEKFEELCLFRREHGHCHVPHHFQENQGAYPSFSGRNVFGYLYW